LEIRIVSRSEDAASAIAAGNSSNAIVDIVETSSEPFRKQWTGNWLTLPELD
jgi:hypothetical protein